MNDSIEGLEFSIKKLLPLEFVPNIKLALRLGIIDFLPKEYYANELNKRRLEKYCLDKLLLPP